MRWADRQPAARPTDLLAKAEDQRTVCGALSEASKPVAPA